LSKKNYIKVTDYIVKRLVKYGVKHVFMVTGGGAMHLNDSFGKNQNIKCIFNHHEQACAIAAEGYSRVTGKLGVVNVTTGPGGLNTLTGVMGQWTDSVPVLYISGQVKFETTIGSCPEIGLRQLGDQEVDIIKIVKPITKFAVSVTNPEDIGRLLEKALYIATHGRPGPVWIDVPMNVQSAIVDENKLVLYDEKEDETKFNKVEVKSKACQVVELLKKSKRPVFVAGHGIRIACAQNLFLEIIKKLNIPVVSTFNGVDLIPTMHPLFIGRIGTVGDRAGNFALQNSDLLLSVGTRNNIRQISYNWENYAKHAKKIVVDIDSAELKKPTIKPDIAINSDAKYFLEIIKEKIKHSKIPEFNKWIDWCKKRQKKYPVVLPGYKDEKNYVNPYYFIKILTELLTENEILVAGNGTSCVVTFQAGVIKKGQRFFWNSGCAAMGYDLPAAIGASLSKNKKKVICLAGDGSLQMNIQELQTVFHYKLPIKLFYLNNSGYVSIKQTQDSFFGRRVGCDESSGISFPDICKIAKAYSLNTEIIYNHKTIKEKIKKILNSSSAVICDVKLNPEHKFVPKVASQKLPDGKIVSKSLEDMYPFLDPEELKENIINN